MIRSGSLSVRYISNRRIKAYATCFTISTTTEWEKVVNLLLVARVGSIKWRDISILVHNLLAIISEWLSHATIAWSWPLSTESMTDAHDFVRRFVEDSTREVIGFGLLAVSNCTHLHLSFFHARDYSLLVSAHVDTTLASFVSIHCVRIQVASWIMTTIGWGSSWLPTASYIASTTTLITSSHYHLRLLIANSHFWPSATSLTMQI